VTGALLFTREQLEVGEGVEATQSQLTNPYRLMIELRMGEGGGPPPGDNPAAAPPVSLDPAPVIATRVPPAPKLPSMDKPAPPRTQPPVVAKAVVKPPAPAAAEPAKPKAAATGGTPITAEPAKPTMTANAPAATDPVKAKAMVLANAPTATDPAKAKPMVTANAPTAVDPAKVRGVVTAGAPTATEPAKPTATIASNAPFATEPAKPNTTRAISAPIAEEPAKIEPAAGEPVREPAREPVPEPALQPAPQPEPPVETKVEIAKVQEPPPSIPVNYAGAKSAHPASTGENSLTRVLGLKINRVVIDPGHGGQNDGATGGKGLVEKDLVLDVSLRLGKLIADRMGAEVIYTRSDDTFVPLEGRTALANEKKADLFLSIHANWSPAPVAAGIETYYLNFTDSADALAVAARENASSQKSVFELHDLIEKISLHDKLGESREFAGRIQSSLYALSSRNNPAEKNRGIRRAPFVVLIGANMPSVLAEIGFLSNPKEEALLKKPDYRQKVAEALFKGVSRYADGLSHVQVAAAK